MRDVWRYRIITNLWCDNNCYFCYQPLKPEKDIVLDIDKMVDVCKKVYKKLGKLKRCTFMGGESTILDNLNCYIEEMNKYVDIMCLVTNGKFLTELKLLEYNRVGLKEIAISVSSKEYYIKYRENILLANKIISNTRINIPRSYQSTDEKLMEIIDICFEDNVGVVVCEDLMGRYGNPYNKEYFEALGATYKGNDGYNFETYIYKNKEFGLFANYVGYDKSDVIITPIGNFSCWETYCNKIGNYELCKK